jgi:hypothetical protein
MKFRILTFSLAIFFLVILSRCTSPKQVIELERKIENLEEDLLYERQTNARLASCRFFIDAIPCRRGAREVKPYSGTYDSLCLQYNDMLNRYYQLKTPYIALDKDFLAHSIKSDSIIKKLKTEYRSMKIQK